MIDFGILLRRLNNAWNVGSVIVRCSVDSMFFVVVALSSFLFLFFFHGRWHGSHQSVNSQANKISSSFPSIRMRECQSPLSRKLCLSRWFRRPGLPNISVVAAFKRIEPLAKCEKVQSQAKCSGNKSSACFASNYLIKTTERCNYCHNGS